ncbi:hypothetical protein NUW58_g10311 [Xylaria curta]|uniref:Uncharacterized protein n=1 Tax=Xylaria curta TaxID=42375 RepID=A0ACC1MMY6_9PEZI|nr:hypothetical protein NUW58_g10311 [Xylaria curta]
MYGCLTHDQGCELPQRYYTGKVKQFRERLRGTCSRSSQWPPTSHPHLPGKQHRDAIRSPPGSVPEASVALGEIPDEQLHDGRTSGSGTGSSSPASEEGIATRVAMALSRRENPATPSCRCMWRCSSAMPIQPRRSPSRDA